MRYIRLEIQKCSYFGRDVGRGRGLLFIGRAAGRDGFPHAPQALMLSFILIFYFIGLYLFYSHHRIGLKFHIASLTSGALFYIYLPRI
jgi:hypothetical protein